MSCYKDLASRIHDKYGDEELGEFSEWAFAMLEQVDPRSFQTIIAKMESKAYAIDKEDAEQVVRAMRPRGEMWTCDQVKEYIGTHGIVGSHIEWYLVMNMVANDFYETAVKFNLQNDTDFFFSLASDFINDIDAKPYKVAKYFS